MSNAPDSRSDSIRPIVGEQFANPTGPVYTGAETDENMLMVILGAGASYDSVAWRSVSPGHPDGIESRPPLADELFHPRRQFAEALDRFPECKPIVPLLRVLPKGRSLEQVLETLQNEASEHPRRYEQLAAVRWYLHFVLWQCEAAWDAEVARGVTNHKTLLDSIDRWRSRNHPVCIVTFNYDRMIESALPVVGITIRALADYIGDKNYRLIKLHGSVNWAREVDTPIELGHRNSDQIAHELIARAAELQISQRYLLSDEYPIGHNQRTALFPAIALPVETKRDFECPPEHVKVLRECIPNVRKLLVIGWRATETPFLRLLTEGLRHELDVYVVSGAAGAAAEVIQKLHGAGVQGRFWPLEGGFSDFIVERKGEELFRQ